MDWDSPCPEHIAKAWKPLSKQLSQIAFIKLNRLLNITSSSQLHVFVDASIKAYGASAYLLDPISCQSQLVCSKSRVAPVKPVTVPRLELTAALLDCQLGQFVKDTYKIGTSIHIWSDSQVVLYWLQNDSKQGTFVSNRVMQIKKHGFNFRFCPGVDNPADLLSRGKTIEELTTSNLWWKGPLWLAEDPTKWPINVVEAPIKKAIDTVLVTGVSTTVNVLPASPPLAPFDIDIKRYSSLGRLLRVTAYCNRFINHVRYRLKPEQYEVSSKMLSESKLQWIKFVQQDKYGTEIPLLKSYKANFNIRRMSLFLDEVGLLRTRGRLQNASVAVEVDSPILLPKGNPLTDLIIADQHNKLMHQGVGHTLVSLRQAYWFPSGRQQVRFVLHRCRVCRRWEGTSYGIPPAPPLPSLRVTREPTFSYTGVDFAGPLYIFNEGTIRKAYICLFVCAVTRDIHLELVANLTTQCFLSAFRRFISRRGVPSLIVSDNTKTFKQASKALNSLFHDVITQSEVVTYSSSKGIKWEFNV